MHVLHSYVICRRKSRYRPHDLDVQPFIWNRIYCSLTFFHAGNTDGPSSQCEDELSFLFFFPSFYFFSVFVFFVLLFMQTFSEYTVGIILLLHNDRLSEA